MAQAAPPHEVPTHKQAEHLEQAKQALKNVDITCICGKLLHLLEHKLLGQNTHTECDVCGSKIDAAVFHCPGDKSPLHPQGFDSCIKCAVRGVKYYD